MAAHDDVSVSDSTAENSGVDQSVVDAINATFGGAPEENVSLANETKAEPAPLNLNAARLAKAAKEQKEELEEDGHGAEEENSVPAEQAEDAAAEDDAEEPDEVDEDEQPSIPEVDPTLRAIAKELGWTDEKIDRLNGKDPELLNETLTSLSDVYSNLSRQYLQAGTQQFAAPQQGPPTQNAASGLDALFNPQALAAFAEANGDELVEKFMKPLYNEVIVPARQAQARAAVAEQQAVASEANGVFSKLAEQYPDVYGKGTALSAAEGMSRNKVAQIADQLRAGAKMQGRELSVTEALNRAHLIETSERRASDGRKQVQQQVQKRSKQITAKPTQRNNPAQASSRKTDSRAAEAYERKAAELGIEV